MDGCAKQYRSGTALFLMSQQVQKFPSIRIDAMIGAPGHGKDEVDGLNAVEKGHIQDSCAVVIQPGVNDTEEKLPAHTLSGDGIDVSLAEHCIKICGHPDRVHGVVSQGKYRKREANRKITNRVYHIQTEATVKHQNAKYKAAGFPRIVPERGSRGDDDGQKLAVCWNQLILQFYCR